MYQGRRGSDVIVIHPGSRFTRIGRACDINPVTVPSVIARKLRGGAAVPEPIYVRGIERPQPGMERAKPVQGTGGGDEYSVSSQSNDPVSRWFSMRIHFPSTVPTHLTLIGVLVRSFHQGSMADHLHFSPCNNSLRSKLILSSQALESE